jgi:S-adenosylmethionine:diacylglycerol 3-amino-3-carboxypropyl transferase/ubiquinone/menaquinone biosynthesis C-methylase UbiE
MNDFLIDKIIKNTYAYNVIFEDTEIDVNALKIKNNDRILTICSAGDHLFYYLIENPELIVACDINPYQIYLTELKKACIDTLSCEEYFEIFGNNNMRLLKTKYDEISKKLTQQAKFYWDQNISNDSIEQWAYSGSSGKLFFFIKNYIKNFTHKSKVLIDMIENDNIDHKWYEENKIDINKEIASVYTKIKDPIFIMGVVPDNQKNLVCPSKYSKFFCTFVYKILNDIDYFMNHNHIFYYYITGRYTKQNCPKYMKPKYYNKIKKNLHKIHLVHGDLQNTVKKYSNPFSVYIPLDHMDWMSNEQLESEFSTITHQMKSGRVLFRSFKPSSDGHFASFLSKYDVYYIDDDKDICPSYFAIGYFEFSKPHLNGNTFIQNNELNYLYVLPHMIAYGLHKVLFSRVRDDHIKNFYKFQANYYDVTRSALLKKRPQMIQSVPVVSGGSYLDLACGTGNNIEYFPIEHLNEFGEITLLDMSPDLCDIAQKRIDRMNLKNARVLCMNAFDLDENKKYDVITISYSLTMIPDWKGMLEKCIRLLKDNGHICICDFTDENKTYQDKFWKWFFSNDGVYFNEDHHRYLHNHEQLSTIYFNVEKRELPLVHAFQVSHYIFVGKKIQK